MSPVRRSGPITLAIDIGGSGLKAVTLDSKGTMLIDRLRVPTPYPLPPRRLIKELKALVRAVETFDRVSVGFPGMVRNGRVLTAPHLVLSNGPDSKVDPDSLKAWTNFDLATALTRSFGKPTRVVNDADLQGLAAATGKGLEVVVTLGTGFGTAVLFNGQLLPHMEFSQHPLRKGDDYDEQIGDVALKKVGKKAWNNRVRKAIAALDDVFEFDRLYIGGGNSKNLKGSLPERVTVIDTNAGLLGGIRLWDQASHTPAARATRPRAPRSRSTVPPPPPAPVADPQTSSHDSEDAARSL
jgi:polyphosphate glucokinase